MLKTLKWVYDLGVRQERVRISSHLQLAVQLNKTSNDAMLGMLSDDAGRKKSSKSRKERLEFELAVNNKVQEIINTMYEDSGGHWITGSSLMFPDDKHKGEM